MRVITCPAKIRFLYCITGIIALSSLFGCTNEEETSINIMQTPPNLTISVGEETVRTVRGSYSWGFENSDGTTTIKNAQSATPPNLVENQKLVNVTPHTDVRLNFGTLPIDYEIRIWGSDHNIIDTYNEVVLTEYKGKVIYEVSARWEQGRVSYAFALNIGD